MDPVFDLAAFNPIAFTLSPELLYAALVPKAFTVYPEFGDAAWTPIATTSVVDDIVTFVPFKDVSPAIVPVVIRPTTVRLLLTVAADRVAAADPADRVVPCTIKLF